MKSITIAIPAALVAAVAISLSACGTSSVGNSSQPEKQQSAPPANTSPPTHIAIDYGQQYLADVTPLNLHSGGVI
jgi:hypothetical protein